MRSEQSSKISAELFFCQRLELKLLKDACLQFFWKPSISRNSDDFKISSRFHLIFQEIPEFVSKFIELYHEQLMKMIIVYIFFCIKFFQCRLNLFFGFFKVVAFLQVNRVGSILYTRIISFCYIQDSFSYCTEFA